VRKLIALLILVLAFACRTETFPVSVRRANVKIVVADTTKTVDTVMQSVEAEGGFVAGSHIWRDGDQLRATLTLRVPSDKLTATLTRIRTSAKRVEDETISSEVVTCPAPACPGS